MGRGAGWSEADWSKRQAVDGCLHGVVGGAVVGPGCLNRACANADSEVNMHEYVTRLELFFAVLAIMAGLRLGKAAYDASSPKVKLWLQQTKIQRLIKRAYPDRD